MRKVNLNGQVAFADFKKYEVGQMYSDDNGYQVVETVEEGNVQDPFGGYTAKMWLHTFRPATEEEIQEYLKPTSREEIENFWSDFFDATETF